MLSLPLPTVQATETSLYSTRLFRIDISLTHVDFSQYTTNPSSLYVLSSTSFTTLHIIWSASLVMFAHPTLLRPDTNNNNVSVSDIDTDEQPHPIYSISRRLVAFASSPPRLDSPTSPSVTQPRAHSRPLSGTCGVSQTELGNVAMTVGGAVLPLLLLEYGLTLHYRLSTVIRHDGYLLEYVCHGQRGYNE
jgi:hypothetical protein